MTPDFWMRTAYLCGGVLIAGIYILIDLLMILEPGIMKTDDYIMGALMLYLDLVRLFLYILELMGKRK
jgi:FtsH-binding integral membrane protein